MLYLKNYVIINNDLYPCSFAGTIYLRIIKKSAVASFLQNRKNCNLLLNFSKTLLPIVFLQVEGVSSELYSQLGHTKNQH